MISSRAAAGPATTEKWVANAAGKATEAAAPEAT
jgi:hypothetical protein